MYNLLEDLYDIILNDEFVSQHITANNFKFYDFPNAQEISTTAIVIDELVTPEMKDFADNGAMTYQYAFEIFFFMKQNSTSNGAIISNQVMLRIQDLMFDNGFKVLSSSAPEYNRDFSLHQRSMQFYGRKYKNV